MSSQRASGVTFSCSSVPSSFSRTIAIADRLVVITSSSSATMPGIMKSRLSRSGLNQTRTSALTSGSGARPPMRAASSSCAVAGDQHARVAERDVRRVRVGAVGDDLDGRRLAARDRARRNPAGMLSAIHARPPFEPVRRCRSVEPTTPTMVKLSDASNRDDQLAARRPIGRHRRRRPARP